MKILHISPSAPYNEGWGYQENLLPKYQKKEGHDVTLIITNRTQQEGKTAIVDCCEYVNDSGVRIIRLAPKKYFHRVITGVCSKLPVSSYLEEIKPDFVFYHGLLSSTIFDVIKYKKKRLKEGGNCVIFQDNHLDYNIGNTPRTLGDKLFRAYYRALNRKSQKFVDKVIGVTPWRKTYAEDYFKINPQKTDVLIMGADDDKIEFAHRDELRQAVREQYHIEEDDFLIVTGGKIDRKKNIHTLIKACLENPKVKLLVFGKVSDDLDEEFHKLLCENPNIIYIGWIDAGAVYKYFFAADLVFFPGQHSVLWEQACAAKVPCVFKCWEGMEHVNNGGNSDFIKDESLNGIKSKISELLFTEKYYEMKKVANSDKTNIYLYSEIAKKSVLDAQSLMNESN